jgi:hypothetical protein
MSVVVPNRISDGISLPSIKVLIQGLKLGRFDSSGITPTTPSPTTPRGYYWTFCAVAGGT